MPLPQEVKDIVYEMIKIQQVLRHTSPNHNLSPEQRGKILDAVSRSEVALAKMKQERELL